MPEVKSQARFVRVAPRKARQVIDLIRGKPLEEALNILELVPKKAAKIIKKVVLSARANAENNFNLEPEALYIAKAYVDDGPRLKRIRPISRFRRHMIIKPLSHITIILDRIP